MRTEQAPQLSIRIDASNPNHHLWNNNGTWWINFTIHPTPIMKERVRHSLRTRSVDEARAGRDALLLKLTSRVCA